ncbi:parapinopsin-like [Cydia pomonella]|uniref:parapinopsin-like n=1 Tax=Cydia pomonella TaxID=82600 RepID=UPI002ADD3FA1|nr:parapinopsin-like [Cydia pomonella]
MTSFPVNWNDTMVKPFDEGFPLLMPRWGYVASAFVLFLIGFFGFFLNLMVIVLMYKDRQLWTPLNIILFNLVCSDFSVSVLGNPFTLVSSLFHRWIFGHTMCVLYGFFMALLGIASITTLTVLSFERYMLVTRPFSSHHLSPKGAIVSIVFIWSYSLALTTPPLMGWGNYVNEAANISCSVNWHEQSMNTLTYILFLFAMGQIVPFIIITFSYVNIVRTLKNNSQRLGRVSRAETKVTGMVFVMIIAFTIAWTPYSVFALMEQFATDGIISPGVGVIPALVAKSSICYDPLIYVGMNTQFRQSIKRFFGNHSKGGLSQTEKGYDNTLMSPAHRMSCLNDSSRQCSETNVSIIQKKPKNRKVVIAEDASEVTNNGTIRNFLRETELCTIKENRTSSDAERSVETTHEDDSSSRKQEYDESSRLFEDNQTTGKLDDVPYMMKNVYGNLAFEEHVTDSPEYDNNLTEFRVSKPKLIKHSYSLDLSGISNHSKKRKLSVESKLETLNLSKTLFKNTVVSKFIGHNPKLGQDNFKSYLCRYDKNESEKEDL